MTWVTWRQHRAQAIGMLVLLAVIAAYAVTVGTWLRSRFSAAGLGGCLAHGGAGCALAVTSFQQAAGLPTLPLLIIALAVPAYLGALSGAPVLGTELGRGTWQLAWSQAVPRRRWLAAKLGLISGALAAFGAAAALLLSWALSPLDRAGGSSQPLAFGVQGILLPCELLCGFSLALLAGLLLRNTIGAMVAGYVAWEVAFTAGILLSGPLHLLAAAKTVPCSPSACAAASAASLPPLSGHPGDRVLGVTREAGHLVVSYLPASAYWPLQFIIGGMYLAIAVAATGATLWLLHRRTT